MKNIHLLPTDKPSRFSLNSNGKYHLTNQLHTNSPNFTNQHLFITNSEELKHGEWYYDNIVLEVRQWKSFMIYNKIQHFKIILTTDQELIADGVQAIDDEFLEWFVKNSSCEWVDIDKGSKRKWVEGEYFNQFFKHYFYKIIIPRKTQQIINEDYVGGLEMGQIIAKEEPKQTDEKGNPLTYWGGLEESKHIPYTGKVWESTEKEEEKINEAAEKHYIYEYGEATSITDNRRDAFIEGAKWMQERMYSEEDLKEAFRQGMDNMDYCEMYGWSSEMTEQEWFEQFKTQTK